ncbi:MAG TPA: hypothetical protein VHT97_09145 [Acidimicrobiales bacterium]|nr:hypothetical protein [Acidimicrobiales bacterium]
MSEHADAEALSAFVDGEAPEWADHVAGCPSCAASAAELRAVSATVAAAVEPPSAAVRDAAIAVALDGGPARPAVVVPMRPGRRPVQARWLLGAVAAMILVVVGVAAALGGSGRSSGRQTTVAGPAFESGKAAAADNAGPAGPVTDLGDVPDAATLRARALPAVPTSAPGPQTLGGGRAASSANSGASSDSNATGGAVPAPLPAAPTAGVAGGATTGNASNSGAGGAASNSGAASAVAPNAVGTRPCEEQARARQPSLGPVVYFATARRQGVPAVVLGFSGPDPGSVTLLMLAQDGCGELLRSAGA